MVENEARPGARASRPHKSWHSLGYLLHPARPATMPGLCFGRAHAVPAGRVTGCPIAGKLSGTQRQCMRAGRPRSRVAPPPIALAARGARQPVGLQPYRCSRAVTLGGPSPIALLCLFQVMRSMPLPGSRRPRAGFEPERPGQPRRFRWSFRWPAPPIPPSPWPVCGCRN